ncbi:hypothetical protein JVT61DRAFT_3420 [Boletus reticuloceps]|uniref:Uncharacterized protein n=1 Tax=Boletus reticuloceps TaxID=495285 RepID=A0A8I2YQF7_9AGAM|nr:hypothetical protein JVT61DRAFT_3420 [Boletus reticuloceps]
MGGPDPFSPGDENTITSLHVGKTKDGHDFADLYSNFDGEVVEAYGQFLSKVFDNAGSRSRKWPSGQPGSESGDGINGMENNTNGKEAEEEPEIGCDGEGVRQDDLDAEGEDDIELGEGTRERRDGEEVEQQPNSPSTSSYSASHAIQATTGFATPLPAHLRVATSPSTHLATLPAALASPLQTTHIATPPTHLATPPAHLATQSTNPTSALPTANFATPPTSHLATPPSMLLATRAQPTADLATPPTSHLATPPSTLLATRAQDVTGSSDLGAPTMQDIQTFFVDLLGNDLTSFGTGAGFDLWGDQFCNSPSSPSWSWANHLMSFPYNLVQGQAGWNSTAGMQLPSPASFQPLNPDSSGTTFSDMLNFDLSAVGSMGGGFNPGYTPFIPTDCNFGGVPDDARTLPSLPFGALNPRLVNPPQTQYLTHFPSVSLPVMSSSLQSSSMVQPPEPLSEVVVPPVPMLPPADPGVLDGPQTQTTKTSNEDSATGARSKRKPMPSLRAQCDNAIGNENLFLTPVTRDGTSKLKRGRPSDAKATSTTKNK